MGWAIDLIYQSCEDIVHEPLLIHDESFMFHIFDDLLEELPEFEANFEYEFKNE